MPSIIVPARNNGRFTADCLASILFSVSRLHLNCEFILVDDASEPEEKVLDAFKQHRANARGHETKIIRSRKHQHYSGVFSLGLNFATRDVVFFISNDMLVTPTFLQAQLLVSSLSRDFGIVRGTSNFTDSHPEHLVESKEPLRNFQEIDAFSRGVFSNNVARYVEDGVLSGDAILIKRALIERIGVLDLRFFGFFGDIDYGMRAHLAGFKLVCAKGAWLYHEGNGHLKFQTLRNPNADFETLHNRRMEMVAAAYQKFRDKWQIPGRETFETLHSLYFFDHARTQRDAVEIEYKLPPEALNDIEIH